MMKKIYFTVFVLFNILHAFGQERNSEILVSKKVKEQLKVRELQNIRTASEELLKKYDAQASLIDPEQHRITKSSIQDFKKLFFQDATLTTDFLFPANNVSVDYYVRLARTYYEREGISFDLHDLHLVDATYQKESEYYITTVQLTKKINHYFSNDSWIYDEKPLFLEFTMKVKKGANDAKIISIQNAPEPTLPQYTQHTFSFLGGTSLITGDLFDGISVNSHYTLGVSYQFIHPLRFLGNSISFIAGAQLKYGKTNTSVGQGTTLVIDENTVDNSVTRINFLTNGNETLNSLSIEPQLGFDIQLREKVKNQMGVAVIFSPRFSLDASAEYVGALSYEEVFNERVTVTNIINCGLRDFEGADAIEAKYNTGLYSAGLGLLISPYYQFSTSGKTGIRLGLDVQYFMSSMYEEGGRFLGNYNTANNPGTLNNPNLDINNSTLLQTVGEELSAWYIGLRLGYYFAH